MPDYELAVIGAGVAGLNALWSAADHLPKGAKVLLIDRRAEPGGMWTETYPYVRLHQPHRFFTVGNLKWSLNRPPEYLATGAEVVTHLTECYRHLGRMLDFEPRFSTDCVAASESADGGEVTLTLRDADGTQSRCTARRVIRAAGFDVPKLAPLDLSSQAVQSTTPERIDLTSDAPAYVVGGGKTGMDTTLALLDAKPGRKVTVLNGKGSVFANRDKTFPPGIVRHWRGHMLLSVFRETAMFFDGTNADETFDLYRDLYTIWPGEANQQFLFGIMSEAECARIEAGAQMVPEYLEDVTDGPDGPEIVTRSGARIAIEPGAMVVNCTGHIARHPRPETTCLSPGGAILDLSPRAAMHFLSSVSGYFLPHLFLSGRLPDSAIWQMDVDMFRATDRKLLYAAASTLTFHNTLVLVNELPFRVLDKCGLDIDRWFPLHRRLAALIDAKWNMDRYLDHCRRSMETVAADHDIMLRPVAA